MSDSPATPPEPAPPAPPAGDGSPATPSAAARSDPGSQVAFDGPRGRLLWILVRNLLLNVATLGIYRFWAKTHVRRFFWRHTRPLGEPFEYVGTGGELFVGFLIVMAVLAPVVGLASLLQFLVENIAFQFVTPAMLFVLTPIAIYRMWRYRLTRTVWRGVRLGLDGSSVRYAGVWLGYGALTIVTLGLANPWKRVATTRYFVNHARFGVAELSLDVRARRLFLPWLAVIALLAATPAVLIAANWPAIAAVVDLILGAQGDDHDLIGSRIGLLLEQARYWPLLIIVPAGIAYARYRAIEFRYLMDNLRVGEVRLRSALSTVFVGGLYLFAWTILIAIVIGVPVILTVWVAASAPHASAGPVIIGALLAWTISVLAFGAAYTLFITVTALAHVCKTLAIENPAALDDVEQASAALPRRGEGLADALDVGGF